MTFRVGQKVVCVDASYAWGRIPSGLTEGNVYTILDFHLGHFPIVEVPSPHKFKCWQPRRFRPLVERKTDISIFKAMLNPSKRSVEAFYSGQPYPVRSLAKRK